MSSSIQGERPPPQVTVQRRLSTKQTISLFIIGTGSVIGLVFWQNPSTRPAEPPPASQTTIRQLVRPEILEPPRPPPVTPAALAVPAPAPLPPAPMMQSMLPQAPAAPRRRMLSFTPAPAQENPSTAPAAPSSATQAGGRTGVTFPGQAIQGARAGEALDLTYLLMPGIYRCVLDTAISSEIGGPFLCHTTQELRSPRGVVLMERGTSIVGQYQTVRQGQRRIPALSVTAYTPHGVPVPLGAQMSDALGRVGFDGEVDTHFWDRFGGATLLLLTQGAMGAAQAALQQGSGNTYLNLGGGGNSLQSVIGETLRGSINIPPTITKNQGEEVAFFVTAPVSFADAYQVVPR